METNFKVGDRVFDIRFGWGEVVFINYDIGYNIQVEFDDHNHSDKTYTEEGKYVHNQNPCLSHTEYSINPNTERLVEVSHNERTWYKRVYIKTIENREEKYLTWNSADTLEKAKNTYDTAFWMYMREVQPEQIVELTLQDISDGKGVGVPAHLIKIKE